jgi:hypothetical protein
MGTGIQELELTADDFGGPDLEGCNELLVVTRPDVVRQLHAAYLDAIEAAEDIPALAPLTVVHRDLAERLRVVADDGAEALADGDLDAYNERLAEQLGALDAEELRDELREATASALAAAVADVEAAEEHALGLLHELERLRRDTPSLVASR